ncbi:non-ribosomal peptide synthetase [Dactylosporangium roseum]|uniref:non-ribosomal peptide synthetase n=1 Tax=Dactylosporangium roseum TaxID=47989 RepID=UPI0021B27D99|nr:non-ribosomal peptide synthetase [Dactylosporangium roseum]
MPEGSRAPVHEQVFAVARHSPAQVAVSGPGSALTYGELRQHAERLSARLCDAGCGPGARVGVVCEPSADMTVAVLGVLASGAAYVPIDITLPPARVRAVLADADVSAVVADTPGVPVVTGALDGSPGRALASPGEALTVFQVNATGRTPAGPAAYVIYTSGTTGEAKGVVVEHEQLTASTRARLSIYPGAATFLLVSPLAFDSSAAGIWGTLTSGGHLVIASADQVRDADRLVSLIAQHRVTRMLCIPSLYGRVLDAAERDGTVPLASLDVVIVAGETLPESLLRRHFAVHGDDVALVNEYGPTEATVFASYRWFSAPGPVTIGRPIPGARLYILDESRRPVAPGVEGELYIGGAGVARGYLGKPDATARAFVADPFDPDPAARMFRTGDVARWAPDGELEFLGRRDHQVKIRGHRVELGAVEEQLRLTANVKDAVALPDATGEQLIAFVTASGEISEAAVRDQLRAHLPAVMVPAVHVVPEFPLTPNGKVDRARLAEQVRAEAARAAVVSTAERPSPHTSKLAQVRAAWARVLNIEEVPVDVNFFDMGGHSLAMFRLQDALEEFTGSRPPVLALFRHTTVAEQVSYLESQGSGPAEPSQARTRAARTRRTRGGRSLTTPGAGDRAVPGDGAR